MYDITVIITASILSGLVGVGVTLLAEKKRIKTEEKMHIFRVLMATRFVEGASYERTRVLNSIDVAFYGVESVLAAWKALYECYANPKNDDSIFATDARDKMIKLLQTMAEDLGYKNLDWTTIKKSYLPRGISNFWEEENEMRMIWIETGRTIKSLRQFVDEILDDLRNKYDEYQKSRKEDGQ